MNFLENGTFNLLFFLLSSLKRMATNVQNKVESIETTLYHHGLVNILVEFHLRSVGDTWEDFLVKNFFQDAPDKSEGSHVKRNRRRKTNLTIQSTPETSAQKNDEEEPTSEKLTEIRKQSKQRRKMKERVEEIHKDIPKPHHLKRMNNCSLKD